VAPDALGGIRLCIERHRVLLRHRRDGQRGHQDQPVSNSPYEPCCGYVFHTHSNQWYKHDSNRRLPSGAAFQVAENEWLAGGRFPPVLNPAPVWDNSPIGIREITHLGTNP
jgi:hypothetical protein